MIHHSTVLHSSHGGKIRGGAITAGCGSWHWATGAGTLPSHGKYRIQYRVDRIDSGAGDIYVGVASRAARISTSWLSIAFASSNPDILAID